MNLGNCSYSSSSTGQLNNFNCEIGFYNGNDNVYRAFYLGDDGAYYISQNIIFTFLIRFWSIFFVSFSIIALSIKFFKLGIKK